MPVTRKAAASVPSEQRHGDAGKPQNGRADCRVRVAARADHPGERRQNGRPEHGEHCPQHADEQEDRGDDLDVGRHRPISCSSSAFDAMSSKSAASVWRAASPSSES